MQETIRIKETNLTLEQLERVLRKLEADLFRDEQKRITGLAIGDPAGPDAGRNIILIDESAVQPPDFVLRQFALTLNEGQLGDRFEAVQAAESKRFRCAGVILVSNQQAVVALFDSLGAAPTDTIIVEGKMSVFGGPNDSGMKFTENLAWIEDEKQAAAYPGYFLPGKPGEGFGHRLNIEQFYLACRWDYAVTPETFLSQRTTICTLSNATGQNVTARPIDWGPHDKTDRVVDLSPAVARALNLRTDDVCRVTIPTKPIPMAAPPIAAGQRRVVFLTGDYITRHVRQRQANAEGCGLTVDFHFNSNGPSARGGEVYFRSGDAASQLVAQRVVQGFHSIGLGDHGDALKGAGSGERRAAFIDHYQNRAVLLEPLFVSNAEEAEWLHNSANFQNLAAAVAAAILDCTAPGEVIGLSIGHLGKNSSPSDRGAPCQLRDMEATHGEALAHAVAQLLMPA